MIKKEEGDNELALTKLAIGNTNLASTSFTVIGILIFYILQKLSNA